MSGEGENVDCLCRVQQNSLLVALRLFAGQAPEVRLCLVATWPIVKRRDQT